MVETQTWQVLTGLPQTEQHSRVSRKSPQWVSHTVAHITTVKTFLTSLYKSHGGEVEYVLSC